MVYRFIYGISFIVSLAAQINWSTVSITMIISETLSITVSLPASSYWSRSAVTKTIYVHVPTVRNLIANWMFFTILLTLRAIESIIATPDGSLPRYVSTLSYGIISNDNIAVITVITAETIISFLCFLIPFMSVHINKIIAGITVGPSPGTM